MRDENAVPQPRAHGDGQELSREQSLAGSKRPRTEGDGEGKAERADGNSFAFSEHRVARLGDAGALSARNDDVSTAGEGQDDGPVAPGSASEVVRGGEEEDATEEADGGNLVGDEDDGLDEDADLEFYLTQLDGGGGADVASSEDVEEGEGEEGERDPAAAAGADVENGADENAEAENDAFCPICSSWLPGICGSLLGRQAHVNACLDGAGGGGGERPPLSPLPLPSKSPSSAAAAVTAAATVAAPRGLITSYLPGGEQARRRKLLLQQKQEQKPRLPPWKAPLPPTTEAPPLLVDCFSASSLSLLGPGSHRLLTHFHSDHYGGLTSRVWSGGPRIICTPGTAALAALGVGGGGGGGRRAPKVPRDRLLPLPLDTPMLLSASGSEDEGANGGWAYRLTLVDARHCPGAAMAVVEAVRPPDDGGGALPPSLLPPPVLHTGDFRWDREAMTRNEALRRIRGAPGLTVVLDTTYCRLSPSDSDSLSFPPRERAVEFAARAVAAEAFRGNGRTLFLFGAYQVGKEELALGVAAKLGKRVWAPASKRRCWRALYEAGALSEELFSTVVTEEEVEGMNRSGGGAAGAAGEAAGVVAAPPPTLVVAGDADGERATAASPPSIVADVHVVPMSCATLKGAERILSHFRERGSGGASSFEAAVVFRPTGWAATTATSAAKRKQRRQGANDPSLNVRRTVRGRVLLYDLPYSEHSSFEELADCVRWLRPSRIVPSVGARFVRDEKGNDGEEGAGLCERGRGMIRALREAAAAEGEGGGERSL